MGGKLSDKDMDQLEQWIGGGPKTFTLLYSASRDGCSAQAFHDKCNNQGPTITVMYNPQGSVYGGYTGINWNSNGAWSTDSAAFLYRLYFSGSLLPVKLPRKYNSTNDMYGGGNYGPTFGSAHDLHTFTGTINQSNGTFALNGHIKIGTSYHNNDLQPKDLNNDTMAVTELEVYQVSDAPRHPVLEKPWRPIPDWNKELLQSLMDEAQAFRGMPDIGIDKANLLLIGPVGAGKSSFINTVNSIMMGAITQPARCGSAEQSLTTAYRQHRLMTRSGETLNFRLCDTRGLEETQGLDVLELDYLLQGNIPNFYEFNPVSPITQETPGFVAKPSASDTMHCAVFVIDATTLDVIPEKILLKIKALLARLNQRGIPSLILLTKVDRVCRDVESDVTLVFKSTKVKDEVGKAADTFGLPRINVLPIKNYENEMLLIDDVNILTLLSLKQILDFARGYMMYLSEKMAALEIIKSPKAKE